MTNQRTRPEFRGVEVAGFSAFARANELWKKLGPIQSTAQLQSSARGRVFAPEYVATRNFPRAGSILGTRIIAPLVPKCWGPFFCGWEDKWWHETLCQPERPKKRARRSPAEGAIRKIPRSAAFIDQDGKRLPGRRPKKKRMSARTPLLTDVVKGAFGPADPPMFGHVPKLRARKRPY